MHSTTPIWLFLFFLVLRLQTAPLFRMAYQIPDIGNLEFLAKEHQTAAMAFYGLFPQPWPKSIQTVLAWILDFRWEAESKVHRRTRRSCVGILRRTPHGCDGVRRVIIRPASCGRPLLVSWLHASA